MGIANLNKLLRKHCPQIYKPIHISEYAFKKIAIDISLYLCKFKAIAGDKWLTSFINLVTCLRRNEIHCVFIYDNGSPKEKENEKAERVKHREKLDEKVKELENDLENYFISGELTPSLIEVYNKEINKTSYQQPRLLSSKKPKIDINILKDRIKKMRGQVLDISEKDFLLTKELFTILNVPFYDAPLEAETMCSDLCKRGIVDAVLSEDTDVLAYGAPIFLSKIDTLNDSCIEINYDYMLNCLDLTKESFLDLCIMCGTDYNKNIYKVGCESSFKYIKKYDNIDNIAKNINLDISELKHIRTRELFTKYEQSLITNTPYCGTPNFNLLLKFISTHNININIDNLTKSFTHSMIIIQDDNVEDDNVEDDNVEDDNVEDDNVEDEFIIVDE